MAGPITTGITTTGLPGLLPRGHHASKTARWATSSEKARLSSAVAIRWFTIAWEWDWSTRLTMKAHLASQVASVVPTEAVTSDPGRMGGPRVYATPAYSIRVSLTTLTSS